MGKYFSEVSVIVDLVKDRLNLRPHAELAQILYHCLEFLLALSLLVISVQRDVLRSVFSENLHFQQS